MSVLVVGSVAYDTVVTPTGSRSEALGGSATYFCVAGSYFAPVSVVAVTSTRSGTTGSSSTFFRRYSVQLDLNQYVARCIPKHF